MPDLTTNFGFRKPLQTEDYNIDDQNFNWNIADNLMGTILCTSSTRPSSPKIRQQIYETDTGKTLVWDGSGWVTTSPGTLAVRRYATAATLASITTTTETAAGMDTGDVYLEGNKLYRIRAWVEWDASAIGFDVNFRIRQTNTSGAIWSSMLTKRSAVATKRYQDLIECLVNTTASAGNRKFVLTAQRDTSGTATIRTFGGGNYPYMSIELLGASAIMTDV